MTDLISVSILKQLTKSYRHSQPAGACYEVPQMTQNFKIYTPSVTLLLALLQLRGLMQKLVQEK